MATLLETVEEKLAARALQYEDTRSLFRMAVALRGEVRQQRREVDLMLEEGPIDLYTAPFPRRRCRRLSPWPSRQHQPTRPCLRDRPRSLSQSIETKPP